MTRDEAGFTLIEALVALALGVAVVAVVLATLHLAAGGARRALEVAAQTEAFERAGALLAGDARHALLMPQALAFRGAPLQVRFAALPRFGGAPVALSYDLRPVAGGLTRLTRSEAPLLAQGPGAFGAAQPVWLADGPWEFRFLDARGTWVRAWTGGGAAGGTGAERGAGTGPDLPRAFGLVALSAPQTVELVAEFPPLMAPDCARGPGPGCALGPEVFP